MNIPACESMIHEFGPFAPPPPADYETDWHGCALRYVCRECLVSVDDVLAKRTDPFGCPDCRREFASINGYITWRPL